MLRLGHISYKDGPMSGLSALTLIHSVIALTGILFGFVAMAGMRRGRMSHGVAVIFLSTTTATSVTGFFFPFVQFLPAHGVGIVSLIVLLVALFALFRKQLTGKWRTRYALAALTAQYLNLFVLVAQAFRRVPALNALAPTQTEPPFAIAEVIVLVVFAAVSVKAVREFGGVRAETMEAQRAASPSRKSHR